MRYLLKGWFRVGDKISYTDALRRFPERNNVIIRRANDTASNHVRKIKWRHEDLEALFQRLHPESNPEFLTRVAVDGERYVQRPGDEHQVDNWKCRRMFLCNKNKLRKCVEANECELENSFPGWDSFRGYIVADEFKAVGKYRLDVQTFVPPSLLRHIRTPKGQHNPIPLTLDQFNAIRTKLSEFR